MSTKKLAGAFGAGAICMGALTIAIAMGPEDEQPEMSAEAMAEMQAWMELGMPGEHHELLAKGVGEWDCVAEFIMEPGTPPTVSKGTMKTEPMFDGRYYKSHMKIDMMGMPMEGYALTSYDNGREEFHAIWIDSMSTAIYHSKGNMSADNSKLVMIGMNYMPEGYEMPMKMETKWHGDDKIVDHFYNMIDGDWVDHGTITYTRKGHAHGG